MRRSRSSSSPGMGLLEGLQTLQGAPPPRGDPLAQFGNGAKSLVGELSTSFSGGVDSLGEGLKGGVTSFRRMVGDESVDVDVENGGAPVQQSMASEMSSMFNLTTFQRLTLFAMCFGAGVVLVMLSFSFLPLIAVMPQKFAASFTVGNILAIASTWILVGPRSQLQTMFHPARAAAAIAYVGSLFFALFAAFFGGKLRYPLVLIALIVELLSCTLKRDVRSLQRSSRSRSPRKRVLLDVVWELFPNGVVFLVCFCVNILLLASIVWTAVGWYSLSYIPYGRQMLSSLCGIGNW